METSHSRTETRKHSLFEAAHELPDGPEQAEDVQAECPQHLEERHHRVGAGHVFVCLASCQPENTVLIRGGLPQTWWRVAVLGLSEPLKKSLIITLHKCTNRH